MALKLSVTERGTWRRCRRQWLYTSVMRLQPKVSAPALELGSLVHASLAEWLKSPQSDLSTIYYEQAQARIDALPEDMDPDAMASFMDIVSKGNSLMVAYQRQYGTPLPDKYELVQPEQEVHIPFESPDGQCYLKMKLDALVRDELGSIYVLEHKTYSRQPVQDALNMNDQFLAYIWGASKLGLGKVGGLLYDGIGKTKVPTFFRTILQRSDEEVFNFERYLMAEAQDMQFAATLDPSDTYFYPNRRWEGCWDCNFVKLCVTQDRGEDFDYIANEFYVVRPPTEVDLLAEPE